MRLRILHIILRTLILAGVLGALIPTATAQADPVADILARINALRTQNGLLPLALSDTLAASAQAHSDDMATTGNVSHTGSDGSSPDDRIRAAGYGHWRDFGIWGENIYGGQSATVDIAWNFWINSQVHRNNLLNTRYREVGIGVATSDQGTFFTLNFGAQPNMLPFFVEEGYALSSPDVTLLLTNENDITTGEGVSIMGRATEVRIGEGQDVSGAPWQPWAESVKYGLLNTPGVHTITMEYRDELGRGSKYSRTVNLVGAAANTATLAPTETPLPTDTPTPTVTPTVAPAATDTPEPTETPTPLPTEISQPAAVDTIEPTNVATSEPTASLTSEATNPILVLPLMTLTPTNTPESIAAILPSIPPGSRLTLPAPQPAPAEPPLIALFAGAPGGLIPAMCILQTLALVIGAVAIARRAPRDR